MPALRVTAYSFFYFSFFEPFSGWNSPDDEDVKLWNNQHDQNTERIVELRRKLGKTALAYLKNEVGLEFPNNALVNSILKEVDPEGKAPYEEQKPMSNEVGAGD